MMVIDSKPNPLRASCSSMLCCFCCSKGSTRNRPSTIVSGQGVLFVQKEKHLETQKMSEINVARQQFKELEVKDIAEHADDVYAKDYVPKKHDKTSAEYGRPKAGTLSEMRAQEAKSNVAREMVQLCEIIEQYGKPCPKTGKIVITFGQLFDIYTHISDKVVGMLLRARKHKMVDFQGEMLFQRRDDAVVISLLLTHEQIIEAAAKC